MDDGLKVKDDRQLTLTDGKKDEQNKNISALKKNKIAHKTTGVQHIHFCHSIIANINGTCFCKCSQ